MDAGDPSRNWTRGGGIHYYNHMCDPSGCTADFGIHIAIVLTIKILYNWISNRILFYLHSKKKINMSNVAPWESDYKRINVDYNLYIPTLYVEPGMWKLVY